jgi:putative hemolysin
VSTEIWIEFSVLVLAFMLLSMAGLVDASLVKRQRLTIRELLENGASNGNAEQGVDQGAELRSAVDVAMLLAVLVIGATATHLTARELSTLWLLAVLPAIMVLILTIGRLVPVAVVDRFSLADSSGIQRIAVLISALMGPFVMLLQAGASLLDRSAAEQRAESPLSGEGGEYRFEDEEVPSGERGDGPHDEHEMISGILSMESAFAREIMVPRPDVVAVALNTPVSDVVRVAQEAGHSRIPVYEDSIDRVRGIVYAKDLLRFVNDDVASVELADLVRPALFVPESKRVDDLLRDLQRARVHLAIVVDEYGGTAGLVTIEDIIEEIVGEIQDEYDRELPLYEFGPEGEVTVDGRMSVDELSEVIGLPMPETESDTIGGLVARELGHIPEPGEFVYAGPVRIEVETVERRRVRTVRVALAEEPAPANASDPVRVS